MSCARKAKVEMSKMGIGYDMRGEGGILNTVKGPSLPTMFHTYNVRFIKLTRNSRKWMH